MDSTKYRIIHGITLLVLGELITDPDNSGDMLVCRSFIYYKFCVQIKAGYQAAMKLQYWVSVNFMRSIGNIHGEHKFQMNVEMDELESGSGHIDHKSTIISKQTEAKLNK